MIRHLPSFFTVVLLFLSTVTFAQKMTYSSPLDQDLSIQNITVMPLVDNVSGIYAKPLTLQITNKIQNNKQWELKNFPDSLTVSPEELSEKPATAKNILQKAKADALITGRVSKGPNGLTMTLSMYSGKDGTLFAQEKINEYSGFEVSDIRAQMDLLYAKVMAKIPYDGWILSRRGQLVTINIGSTHGLHEPAEINVVQIIKANRHPKFKFLVSTEKEILGKLKVFKVEEHLSFANIMNEQTENIIQAGQKVSRVDFVKYPDVARINDGKVVEDLNKKGDQEIAFGEGAKEWQPDRPPAFGKVGLMFGLGNYTMNTNIDGVGGQSANRSLAPSIHLDAEMWFNPRWFIGLELKQYVLSFSNPYSGASPATLNVSTSQTTLQVGHNFLMQDEFYGPKIKVLGGYSKMSSYVDTSTPTVFTSMTYSGMLIGLGGYAPLELENRAPYGIGAQLNYYWQPSVDESPVTSGSGTSQVTSFKAYIDYKHSMKINFKGALMYDLFSTNFTGSGSRQNTATSASHSMATVGVGIEYLF